LFYVEEDEIKREDRILEALIQYNLSNGNALQPSKPSGDLKIWIYLGSKDSENCVNVTVSMTFLNFKCLLILKRVYIFFLVES